MRGKILHIMVLDKFIPPFIDFINDNFDIREHRFLIIGKKRYEYGLTDKHPVEWIDKKQKVFSLLREMYSANKIILHGLWSENVNRLLFLQPWLLKKCYWVMWGGDFYFPEKQSKLKRFLIRKLKHFVTYLEDDYEYVKKHYGAEGELHECLMYTTNIFKGIETKQSLNSKDGILNVLIGNSATPENNHIWIFNKILKFKNKLRIYVPLSYGNSQYADYVISEGRRIFGRKFYPLKKFMPYNDYLNFLSTIDIAIFAHDRQQAMGNTIALLGMGKKVFMKRGTSQWKLFDKLGIKVFDVENLSDKYVEREYIESNVTKVTEYFSEINLKNQWSLLFNFKN